MFVQLCPAPDQHSLSCHLLIKLHFKLFLGEVVPLLCAWVFGGLSISNWSCGPLVIQANSCKGLEVSEIKQ